MGRMMDEALAFARDLHEAGAMDDATMREIEGLATPRLPSLTADDIRRIRAKAKMSQQKFADFLRVGTSTVAQWEQGRKTPSGPAMRLLDLIDRKGIDVLS
jgi:putative transcriptional regulator